eukprot:scaffold14553_cov74-Phaeocystis_antarctica.AAC.1
MGDLLLLAITCVCRLHWSARRGSWSRVIRWGVDFIPMKFLWRTGTCAITPNLRQLSGWVVAEVRTPKAIAQALWVRQRETSLQGFRVLVARRLRRRRTLHLE